MAIGREPDLLGVEPFKVEVYDRLDGYVGYATTPIGLDKVLRRANQRNDGRGYAKARVVKAAHPRDLAHIEARLDWLGVMKYTPAPTQEQIDLNRAEWIAKVSAMMNR